MIDVVPIADVPEYAVEQLLDRAFGATRHQRAAYRIRHGTASLPELSFAALDEGGLVGTIQCWPVLLTCDNGEMAPLVMVGPVAVEPARQQGGIGQSLMRHSLAIAALSHLADALMLIGDPEYYGRFFGFSADHTTAWRIPGRIEQHRLLARGPKVPVGAAGMLGPRIAAHA